MTRPASSCRSKYQLQDGKAEGLVSVDAAHRRVPTRDRGKSFYCEVSIVGVSPRVKIWVGTYPKEELAALAYDVAFFYTNRPSSEFKLENSEDLILLNCKPKSAFDSLNDWKERKIFIIAEANALINLIFSQDHAPDFRWADVTAPPLVPGRQRTRNTACTLVEQFRNRAEPLREFMAWLMLLSAAATGSTHTTFMQQQSEETRSQLDTEEPLPVVGDQVLDAPRVSFLLESVEARLGGALWLTLIAKCLPLLLQIYSKTRARDATSNANDPKFTEPERCQRAECSTKRRKAKHPSIELVPDQEVSFTAILLNVTNEAWQCLGYDMRSKMWKELKPFSAPLDPHPHPNLSKEYSICGHGSLMCANVSTTNADLVVFNPLTGKSRPLPPLISPKHPVLLHMVVDSATYSYKVIVAGSSSSRPGEDHLSKKMEVFDSKTSQWEEMCELPWPAFWLNEYQTGVCANGILYFISFLEGGVKGVVAFDVENGEWLPNKTCPIPYPSSANMLQLVENNGVVYLFSELVDEEHYKHCIDVLEISHPNAGEVTCQWRNECQLQYRIRPHESLSKHTCVGFGEDMLCIFDNLGTGGVVYDMRCGRLSQILEQRPRDPDLHLSTKIPASFNLQLSCDSDPFPLSVDDIELEVPLIVHPYLEW